MNNLKTDIPNDFKPFAVYIENLDMINIYTHDTSIVEIPLSENICAFKSNCNSKDTPKIVGLSISGIKFYLGGDYKIVKSKILDILRDMNLKSASRNKTLIDIIIQACPEILDIEVETYE